MVGGGVVVPDPPAGAVPVRPEPVVVELVSAGGARDAGEEPDVPFPLVVVGGGPAGAGLGLAGGYRDRVRPGVVGRAELDHVGYVGAARPLLPADPHGEGGGGVAVPPDREGHVAALGDVMGDAAGQLPRVHPDVGSAVVVDVVRRLGLGYGGSERGGQEDGGKRQDGGQCRPGSGSAHGVVVDSLAAGRAWSFLPGPRPSPIIHAGRDPGFWLSMTGRRPCSGPSVMGNTRRGRSVRFNRPDFFTGSSGCGSHTEPLHRIHTGPWCVTVWQPVLSGGKFRL